MRAGLSCHASMSRLIWGLHVFRSGQLVNIWRSDFVMHSAEWYRRVNTTTVSDPYHGRESINRTWDHTHLCWNRGKWTQKDRNSHTPRDIPTAAWASNSHKQTHTHICFDLEWWNNKTSSCWSDNMMTVSAHVSLFFRTLLIVAPRLENIQWQEAFTDVF